MNRKQIMIAIGGLVVIVAGVGAVAYANSGHRDGPRFARGNNASTTHMGVGGQMDQNLIVGKIESINGNSITVSGFQNTNMKPGSTTADSRPVFATTTYTVDITNAQINKLPDMASSTAKTGEPSVMRGQKNASTSRPGAITITALDLKVGDMVMVHGTITGTNIVAQHVTVGIGMMGKFEGRGQMMRSRQNDNGMRNDGELKR